MPQKTRKRRRKHRGTQGGRIDARSRARPRNRQEARARARSQRGQRGQRPHRHDIPPSWRSAFFRGGFAALAFFAIVLFGFGRSLGQALALSAFMLAFYVPLGYYTDRMFYNRRQRKLAREREERRAEKAAG